MARAIKQSGTPDRPLSVPSEGKAQRCQGCMSGLRKDVLESETLDRLRAQV